MSAEITIAVVSWNTRELLRSCLQSLADEHSSGRADVWVIDNASSDGSVEMVQTEFPWVSLIASGENLGFGPAVNEVASRTSAPWIAPANADIELEPETLDRLLAAGADADVGIVAPRLVGADGQTQHSVHAFPTVSLAALFALGAYRLPGVGDRLCVEGYWDAEKPRVVDWAHGAFLLVRREAFDAVGGFDPAQWMYAEDIDLHWRIRRAGYRARYEPGARVRHAGSAAAVQAFGAGRTQRHLDATYEWLARRRGITLAWASALLNVIGGAARWAGLALASVASPSRFGGSRARIGLYTRWHARGLRGKASLARAVRRPS